MRATFSGSSPTEAIRGSISSQDTALYLLSRPPNLRVGSVIWRAISVNRGRALIALGQGQPWHLLAVHAQLKLYSKVPLIRRGRCVQHPGFPGEQRWLLAHGPQLPGAKGYVSDGPGSDACPDYSQ